MRYPHLLMTCAAEVWALQREKLETVSEFLLFQARGGNFLRTRSRPVSARAERSKIHPLMLLSRSPSRRSTASWRNA